MRTLDTEEVTLRDGSVAEIRPVRDGDVDAIRLLFAELSLESRAKRFMTGAVDVDKAASVTARVGDPGHLALVAHIADRMVAVGSYDVSGPGLAEVAFAVADDAHGHGLGTLLLGAVAAAAHRAGIAQLEALVLPSNRAMIEVFRESGFPVSVTSERGLMRVEFPSALTAEARERFEQRERLAAVAGVSHVLRPESVAVIGASPRHGTVAGEVTSAVTASAFDGPVHLVNLHHRQVDGRPVVRSVLDVPDSVELAVVVVPAGAVCDVARACAAKGVRALLVLTAGFAEAGDEGRRRQAELLAICRTAGMRLVGPNCMGLITTTPRGTLSATFAPERPPAGAVAIATQSGGLGLAAMHNARELGIGVSAFVSFGNRADVSSNDLLQYWEQDPATGVVLLYLESFGRARAFSRIARRVTRSKPVVAVKAGRTPAGARAAGSHTGAMVAASDLTVDALFRQAGVVRVDTPEELLEVGGLLAALPAPKGPRVAIVSNAGGLGILAADACGAVDLAVPELSAPVLDAIAKARPEAAGANPVDLLPDPSARAFRRVAEAIAASGEADAIVAIYAHPFTGADPELPATLTELAAERRAGIPIVPVLIGGERPDGKVPILASPERAVRALAHAWAHQQRACRPAEDPPRFADIRADEAAAILAEALGRGEDWLAPPEVSRLLDAYGIPRPRTTIARSARAAAAAAHELGGPVALKLISPDLVHKTEAGAVRTGLTGRTAVARAAGAMRDAASAAGRPVEGFLVQEMVSGGPELLVGVVQDDVFGPVVACGAGGTTAELLHDVGARLAPLTRSDAEELLRSLASFPLLDGYRGAAPADTRAVEDVLLRIGLLADAHPEITEIDLNPVIATPSGAVAVDARVRIRAAA